MSNRTRAPAHRAVSVDWYQTLRQIGGVFLAVVAVVGLLFVAGLAFPMRVAELLGLS